MRTLFTCFGTIVLGAACATAQLPPFAGAKKGPTAFEKAVQKVEATFTPVEAKPGQTVTFKLTVHLSDGYHTYPVKQTDKAAAGMVNKLTFPDPGAVIFVGETRDPLELKSKAEPLLGIQEMLYIPGVVVYERKAVVSPKAPAGAVTVKLPAFRISVCDKDNCYPAKTLTPEATFKVLDGPAVSVEKTFAEEVMKATGG